MGLPSTSFLFSANVFLRCFGGSRPFGVAAATAPGLSTSKAEREPIPAGAERPPGTGSEASHFRISQVLAALPEQQGRARRAGPWGGAGGCNSAPRAGPTRVNRRPQRLGASPASQARSYITVPGSFPPLRPGPRGPCPLLRPPACRRCPRSRADQGPQGREASALSPEAPGTSWKSGSARGWGLRPSFPIRNQGAELGLCVSQLVEGVQKDSP